MEKRIIQFSPPDIGENEINEVVDTLKSGWITTGPKTKELERCIASLCDTKTAVTFNSCTAALEMTLRLLGIGPGDEVITSAYTYTASASAITHVGAKVVLVDSGKNSFHIDYDAIADAITEKTKAIIPVDIGGVMADYDKLFEVIESKKDMFNANNKIQDSFGRIIIIADGAHSLGSTYKGKKSGNVADFTSFSFHAVKNLTTAEGGAVTWRPIEGYEDEYIYNEYMLLSLHGQSKDALSKMQLGAWEYDVVAPNYKCNMPDVLASIGLAQIRRYSGIVSTRKDIIEKYDTFVKEKNLSSLKHYTDMGTSSGHLYLLSLTGRSQEYRNNLIIKMAERGIATNVHYKPLPLLTAYKNLGFDINDYPNAYEMFENEVTLPLHDLLSDEDVEYIINSLRDIMEELDVK